MKKLLLCLVIVFVSVVFFNKLQEKTKIIFTELE